MKSLLSTGKVLIFVLNISVKFNISFCVKSNNVMAYSWKLELSSGDVIEVATTKSWVAPIERHQGEKSTVSRAKIKDTIRSYERWLVRRRRVGGGLPNVEFNAD